MEKSKLTFLPVDERTTEQKYEDIQKRNVKIEKEILNIMEAWSKFKSEVSKIEKKKKRTDNMVYGICFTGIAICSILLIILQWSK